MSVLYFALPFVSGNTLGMIIAIGIIVLWLGLDLGLIPDIIIYLLTRKDGSSAEGIFFYDPSKITAKREKHLTR